MRDCANIALPLLRPAVCQAPGMLASVSPTPSCVEFSRRHRRRCLRSSDAARRSTKFTEASEANAPKRRCVISCEWPACAWQSSTSSQSSSWPQASSSPSSSLLLFSPCRPPDRDRWRSRIVPARIARHCNSITTAQQKNQRVQRNLIVGARLGARVCADARLAAPSLSRVAASVIHAGRTNASASINADEMGTS